MILQQLPMKFPQSSEGEDDKDEHQQHFDGQLYTKRS